MPGRVEGLDHVAELVRAGRARSAGGGVGRLRGGEGDRVVAPEVRQLLAGQRVDERAVVLVELVDRQQLDGRDARATSGRGSSRPARRTCPGCGTPRRRVAGEPADVQLVDDRVLERDERRGVVLPVVPRPAVVQAAARRCDAGRSRRAGPPDGPVGEQRRRRGRGAPGRVEPVAAGRSGRRPASRSRTVGGRPSTQDVPVVAGAVERGSRAISASGASSPSSCVEDERDGRAVAAEQGEVEPVVGAGDAERQRPAAGGAEGGGGRVDTRGGSWGRGRGDITWATAPRSTPPGYAVSDPLGAPRSVSRRMPSSASHRIGLSS